MQKKLQSKVYFWTKLLRLQFIGVLDFLLCLKTLVFLDNYPQIKNGVCHIVLGMFFEPYLNVCIKSGQATSKAKPESRPVAGLEMSGWVMISNCVATHCFKPRFSASIIRAFRQVLLLGWSF